MDAINELKPGVLVLMSAAEQLRTSRRLAQVLQLVLSVGNFLNAGSRNSGARGFRIDVISKLSTVKTSDSSQSLLHVVVRAIEERQPELLQLAAELPDLRRACAVSVSSVSSELQEMAKGLQQVQRALERSVTEAFEDGDYYLDGLQRIAGAAAKEYSEFKESYDRMQRQIESTLMFFGEEQATPAEDFFSNFNAFVIAFETCAREVSKIREREQKEAERQRERAERERQQQERKRLASRDDDGKQGVMDTLIGALRSGTAFSRSHRKQAAALRVERPVDMPAVMVTKASSRDLSSALMEMSSEDPLDDDYVVYNKRKHRDGMRCCHVVSSLMHVMVADLRAQVDGQDAASVFSRVVGVEGVSATQSKV
jgi:diaphanous 2